LDRIEEWGSGDGGTAPKSYNVRTQEKRSAAGDTGLEKKEGERLKREEVRAKNLNHGPTKEKKMEKTWQREATTSNPIKKKEVNKRSNCWKKRVTVGASDRE